MHVDKGKFNYFIFRLVLVGAPPLDAAAVRTPMSGVFEAAAKNEQKMKKTFLVRKRAPAGICR